MTRFKLSNKVLERMYKDWSTIDTYNHTVDGFIEYFLSLGWDLKFDALTASYNIPAHQAPFFLLTYLE